MENVYTKRDGNTSTTGAPAGASSGASYDGGRNGSRDGAPRKKHMSIELPLSGRDDKAGGTYYIAAEVNIDQNVNLGDYVILVLMGKKDDAGHGPGPRIVMRPRDSEYIRDPGYARDTAP